MGERDERRNFSDFQWINVFFSFLKTDVHGDNGK